MPEIFFCADIQIFWGLNSYDHSYDFVHQDDPVNGTYIYFQPKEQFKSTDANGNPAQRYISGFSYFLAGDKETKDNRFGTNYEYMQTFAKENGFELLKDKTVKPSA